MILIFAIRSPWHQLALNPLHTTAIFTENFVSDPKLCSLPNNYDFDCDVPYVVLLISNNRQISSWDNILRTLSLSVWNICSTFQSRVSFLLFLSGHGTFSEKLLQSDITYTVVTELKGTVQIWWCRCGKMFETTGGDKGNLIKFKSSSGNPKVDIQKWNLISHRQRGKLNTAVLLDKIRFVSNHACSSLEKD